MATIKNKKSALLRKMIRAILSHIFISIKFAQNYDKVYKVHKIAEYHSPVYFFLITVNIWRRSGFKVRLTSPYATKIGKFIEFFYLFICIGKFYEFSGANVPKH